MAEPKDPQKMQEELMEQMKRFFQQAKPVTPQTDKVREEEEEKQKKERREKLKFDLKPKEVKKYLDRFVIQQDEAKRVLATAVCDHYRHLQHSEDPKAKHYVKQNIVMLGPTGVGKTFLVKSLSQLIGVPFVKADATKFSETGYVGGDVDDLARELVHKAGGDIELAECGMVYIDEIDKIAGDSGLQGKDVSGRGVQRGLLKMMEDTEIPLRNPQDIQSQIQGMMEYQQKGKVTRPTIKTRNILFIVSGAFSGLEKIIDRRIKAANVGFAVDHKVERSREEVMRKVITEDLIEFGFEPEFVGRLPVRVLCDPLSAQDLFTILKTSEGSILKQYEAAFAAYNIHVRFEDDAIWEIAKQASQEGTGGRALMTVCERVLRELKYELPSSKIQDFVLTGDMVRHPDKGLKELLKEERKERMKDVSQAVKSFEKTFMGSHGISIRFDSQAVELIGDKVLEADKDVSEYLGSLLSNYAYGLGLVQKKKPRKVFELDREALLSPNLVLENWIKETFEEGA